MGTTPTYGWPYPEVTTDPPNGPAQIQAALEAVEDTVVDVEDDVSGLDNRVDAIEAGYSATDRQAVGFGTTTSTSFTTSISGGQVAGVAFTAPPSGKVLIINQCYFWNSGSTTSLVTFRVRTGSSVGSGTDVKTPADNDSILVNGTDGISTEKTYLLTSLTPGSSYNVQQLCRVSGGTGTFNRHSVVVMPA